MHRRPTLLAAAAAVALLASACAPDGPRLAADGTPLEVRLGYFPNVTHAAALVAVDAGLFADHLGAGVDLQPTVFTSGPAAMESLLAGSVDATFVGPSPAVNAYLATSGTQVRIVAGATSGGASLVVQPGIEDVQDLRGKAVASPQFGNTQDVAVRNYLLEQGLRTETTGEGDVEVRPMENSTALTSFREGDIAGAFVPEPWASRLVLEAGGTVLVDERDLWPGGEFATTVLVVRTAFLERHPEQVRALIEATAAAVEIVEERPDEALERIAHRLDEDASQVVPPEVLRRALDHLTATTDPLAATVEEQAAHAAALGFLDTADVRGIFALDLLDEVRTDRGQPPARAMTTEDEAA